MGQQKDRLLVISKSAGIDDGVEQTVTQLIITNNLSELGYGGFTLCNLVSDPSGKSQKINSENSKAFLGLLYFFDLVY